MLHHSISQLGGWSFHCVQRVQLKIATVLVTEGTIVTKVTINLDTQHLTLTMQKHRYFHENSLQSVIGQQCLFEQTWK